MFGNDAITFLFIGFYFLGDYSAQLGLMLIYQPAVQAAFEKA